VIFVGSISGGSSQELFILWIDARFKIPLEEVLWVQYKPADY
jgi:hypothetical protein